MVYSTCSLCHDENERVVEHLLKRTDAVLDDVGSVAGIPTAPTGLPGSMRIFPGDPWAGFFLARLTKPDR